VTEGSTDGSDLVLRDVEVDDRRVDVVVRGGAVEAIGPTGSIATSPTIRTSGTSGTRVLDGRGGALIPGLHDHHIHLFATAALDRSVRCGPPHVRTRDQLAAALRAAPGDGWIRGVGYHERVAGDLDRDALDRLVGDRPARIQHRSGAQWVLSSAGCRAVGLDAGAGDRPPDAEVDDRGRATGRLRRLDAWLRDRTPSEPTPDVAALSRRLAGFGVTGLTDATPIETVDELRALAGAGVVQHLQLTGSPALADAAFPDGVARGPVKVVLGDHDLPPFDDVVAGFTRAHAAGRPVAVHCVTRVALVLAMAALQTTGSRPGDRIEHASVAPLELLGDLVELGLTVITPPAFVAERGDDYLADVDPADVADLYRCASLLEGGVPVAGSTDAPYADPDPWRSIAAAIDRTTPDGVVLGAGEALTPRAALDLFLTPLDDPGGPPRRVAVGAPADLVLLAAPLDIALREPASDLVTATILGGEVVVR
jgi:predicted amidohydrolase YtcJ